jgi:hypothetical protein
VLEGFLQGWFILTIVGCLIVAAILCSMVSEIEKRDEEK